jgi:hypothetical protein
MLITAAAELAIVAMATLVTPLGAGAALRAAAAVLGSIVISAAIYFFIWPRSNAAAFASAIALHFEHSARCLDALVHCLLHPDIHLKRQACFERERVRNAVAFNQRLVDEQLPQAVLDSTKPAVRSMYDTLECLLVLDRSVPALSALNGAGEARAAFAAGLREFSDRFENFLLNPPSAAMMLGDVQRAAAFAPVETDDQQLLLLGTVFWMRRMDAAQRQLLRDILSLPPEMLPQR